MGKRAERRRRRLPYRCFVKEPLCDLRMRREVVTREELLADFPMPAPHDDACMAAALTTTPAGLSAEQIEAVVREYAVGIRRLAERSIKGDGKTVSEVIAETDVSEPEPDDACMAAARSVTTTPDDDYPLRPIEEIRLQAPNKNAELVGAGWPPAAPEGDPKP